MTAGLFYWVSNLLALTPYERFQAMRKLNDPGNSMHALFTNKWFVLLGWSVIFILIMVLLAVRQQRNERKRKRLLVQFEEHANEFGLTREERDMLLLIARYARLRQPISVFTLQNAFEKGIARLLEKMLDENSDDAQAQQINQVIETIKTKIGFVRAGAKHSGRFRGGRYMTSRQIAVGKPVSIVTSSQKEAGTRTIQGDVAANDQDCLKLSLEVPPELKPGEACTLQAQFGAVLWGFEMIVVLCKGTELVLHHVDQARYLNRRRFQRVPTHKEALVAPFPVLMESGSALPVKPQFVPAEVKELSGPGLRLSTSLEADVKDRLIVIFEFESGRVIQDVAEVRRIIDNVTGRTLAVELIGLPESTEDELIRVTNQLAMDMETLSASDDSEEDELGEDELEEGEPSRTNEEADTIEEVSLS